MKKEARSKIASLTAINGLKNEDFVAKEFKNWRNSVISQNWLKKIGYDLEKIEYLDVNHFKNRYKSDLQITVKTYKRGLDVINFQIKLVSSEKNGFNQVDKRALKTYKELWDIPKDVYKTLQYYTGELKPTSLTRDSRRMFIDEFTEEEQNNLVKFVEDNKILIVSDIIKGEGRNKSADWYITIHNKKDGIEWGVMPINKALNKFGQGQVSITPRGNLKIGNITMQRKGGDAGKSSANMLQFKIDPLELME